MEKSLQATQWSQLTWPEIGERIAAGADAALLPLGATEQHGPHLGTGMDYVLVDHWVAEVSRRTGVLALPTLPYGCSIGHSQRWPGTLALSPVTFITVLTELGDWLYASGIRRLFFVNCHVGNAASIRCALDTLRCRYDDFMIAAFNDGDLTTEIAAEFSRDAADWHANAAETSLMLAKAPALVRTNKLAEADDPDRTADKVFAHPVNRTSRNGVTGKPSLASTAEGESLFEALVEALCERVRRGLSEQPPLDASYCNNP